MATFWTCELYKQEPSVIKGDRKREETGGEGRENGSEEQTENIMNGTIYIYHSLSWKPITCTRIPGNRFLIPSGNTHTNLPLTSSPCNYLHMTLSSWCSLFYPNSSCKSELVNCRTALRCLYFLLPMTCSTTLGEHHDNTPFQMFQVNSSEPYVRLKPRYGWMETRWRKRITDQINGSTKTAGKLRYVETR